MAIPKGTKFEAKTAFDNAGWSIDKDINITNMANLVQVIAKNIKLTVILRVDVVLM